MREAGCSYFLMTGRVCTDYSSHCRYPKTKPQEALAGAIILTCQRNGGRNDETEYVIHCCGCDMCSSCGLCADVGLAQDKNAKPAKKPFIPSPVFSPPYPPLPHHFSDVKAISNPVPGSEGGDQTGADAASGTESATAICLSCCWVGLGTWKREDITSTRSRLMPRSNGKASAGNTTLIEYIDSDMGLLAGREPYGWPKKMADITWTQTATGWTITAKKLKDQGSIPLMKIEYKISKSTPAVKWPDMGPIYLVQAHSQRFALDSGHRRAHMPWLQRSQSQSRYSFGNPGRTEGFKGFRHGSVL